MPTALERLKEVQSLYKASPCAQKMKAIILGAKGIGKTSLAKTCPGPVLLHSFDPGGAQVVPQKLIDSGKVIVDNSFEDDNLLSPTAYLNWIKKFNLYAKEGVFNEVGTYILDSTTTLAHCMLWQIAKKEGRLPAGLTSPTDKKVHGLQMNDWDTVRAQFLTITRQLMKLPCHVLLIGHLSKTQDEVTGGFVKEIALPGQSRTNVPVIFSEVFVMQEMTKAKFSDGTSGTRVLQTSTAKGYTASTRMGAGIFDQYEKPDIRFLLKKAGKDASDVEEKEEKEGAK